MITKIFSFPLSKGSLAPKISRGIILNKKNKIFHTLPTFLHNSEKQIDLPKPKQDLLTKSAVQLEGEFSKDTLIPYLDYYKDFHQRSSKSTPAYSDEFMIGRKEFLMAGASNVGKSSLINSIFSADAALVSKTPGKTRNLFFYKLSKNPNFVLVDAPGYGYAVGSKKEIDNWAKAMNIYLKKSQFIHRVLV